MRALTRHSSTNGGTLKMKYLARFPDFVAKIKNKEYNETEDLQGCLKFLVVNYLVVYLQGRGRCSLCLCFVYLQSQIQMNYSLYLILKS